MLIFKPKTKRYRISVDIEASGTVTLEKEFPLKLGQLNAVQVWEAICEELSRLHEETGIEFEPRQETLKVEEWVDDDNDNR